MRSDCDSRPAQPAPLPRFVGLVGGHRDERTAARVRVDVDHPRVATLTAGFRPRPGSC